MRRAHALALPKPGDSNPTLRVCGRRRWCAAARRGVVSKPVMGDREERLGRNEVLFRDVNERIAEAAESFDVARFEIFCECANVECVERIELSPLLYEQARQGEATFIIVDGHADPSI